MARSKAPRDTLNLMRIAAQGLALLVVIPTLVIFYLFKEEMIRTGTWPALLFLLLAVSLGFYLLWQVFRSISEILSGLEKVSKGETDSVEIKAGSTQLKEMTDIINVLNRITSEFRENAAQLEQFIRQFATLTELTQITAKVPNIDELLHLVLNKAMSATHARIGSIMLLNDAGTHLDVVAAMGWTPPERLSIPLEESVGRLAIERGETILVEDIEKAIATRRPNNTERYTSSSFLICPLKTKTSCIGIVSLADRTTGGAFNVHDEQFMTVLLGQIGYAVENARLLAQAREAAKNLMGTVRHQQVQLEETQRKMAQAEKLSALGQLAGGVAHDFNNLLQAILGYADIVSRSLSPSDPRRQDLEQIRGAARRASSLTGQLLAFGRRQVLKPIHLDLNRVVTNLIDMLKRLIGEHIELSVLSGSQRAVFADPVHVEQVLVNLCINARDAMPDGGTITLETSDVHVTEEDASDDPLKKPGEYVCLTVSDQGCGMDRETLLQVFEPFFTTKESGKGTGLGLSTVYGIVNQHNGMVNVVSEPGKGTTFYVYFPAAEDSTKVVDHDEPEPTTLGGNETILVAEDDETVRQLSSRVLANAGYSVLLASDGEAALRVFREHRGTLSLAILDALMPKMSGIEVGKQVREIQSNMPILFSSGYSPESLPKSFPLDEYVSLITKPYSPTELLRRVREILDSRSENSAKPEAKNLDGPPIEH
ncbi:response regulator [Candidatus Sumerlaeota bacterium]|nr:response regulator [Candidatus Sumerlaeota bacterium]